MTKQLTILLALIIAISTITLAQAPPSGQGPKGNPDPNNMPKIGIVKGNIVDAKTGAPVEYATIAFYHKRLNKIMSGGISDDKGNFIIENIPMGMYQMKVEFIGYDPYVVEDLRIGRDNFEHTFKNIKLNAKVTELGEVNVTAERAVIVNKIDRKVVSVDKDLVSAGGSAVDVLENVPSVDVDTDGNISLRGSQNVTILIDGRPSGLSAESTGALLEAIPSESIESIEIITNPSAKYDPEGVSGILNVKLKKNKLSGFNGQISAGIGTNGSYNGGLNLNYRNSNMNLTANYNYRQFERPMEGFNDKIVYVGDTTKYFNDVNESDRTGKSHSLSLNADFFLNPTNVWSIGGRLSSRNMERSQYNIYENYYDPGAVYTDYYRNDISSSNLGISYDLNTNYRKTFSQSEHFLEGEIALSKYNSEMDQKRTQSVIDLTYYPDGFVPSNLSENTISDSRVNTFRLDYAQPFDNGKLELGTKTTLRKVGTDYIAGQENTSGGIDTDPSLTNHFVYTENVYALYAQYSGALGKFSYQAGLRGEYADINSELITTGETYPRNYYSLYPSVFILHKLNKSNEVNLNYSRRVNRPHSRSLNPFGIYSDPYNVRKGNPNLNPEFVNAIEAGFTHYINKSMLNATIYYRYVTDVISHVNTIDDYGVSTITYDNIGSRESYGGEVTFSGQFFKWWSMNSGFNFYQLSYSSGESLELSNAGFSWNLKASNNFRISPNLSAQLSGRYDAARIIPQGKISANYAIDAGIKQDLFKKKASINVRVRDIFNTRKFSYNVTGSNYALVSERYPTTRMLQVSFSYKFGKMTDRSRDRKQNQENGDDMGDFEL